MTKLAYTSMGVELAKVMNKINAINKDIKDMGADDWGIYIKSEVIISLSLFTQYKTQLKYNGIDLSMKEIIELEQVMSMISNTERDIVVSSDIRNFRMEAQSIKKIKVLSNEKELNPLLENLNGKEVFLLDKDQAFDVYQKGKFSKNNDEFKLMISEIKDSEKFNTLLDDLERKANDDGVIHANIYKDLGLETNILKVIEVFNEDKLDKLVSKYKSIIQKILKTPAKEFLKTSSSYYYSVMDLNEEFRQKINQIRWEGFYNEDDDGIQNKIKVIEKMLTQNNWHFQFQPIIDLFENSKENDEIFQKGLKNIKNFQKLFFTGYELDNPVSKILNGWRTVNSPKTSYDNYSFYTTHIEGYLVAKIDKSSSEDKIYWKNKYRDFIAEMLLVNPVINSEYKFHLVELIEKNFTKEQKQKVYDSFKNLAFESENENWFKFNIDNSFSRIEIDADYFQFNRVHLGSNSLPSMLSEMKIMNNFIVDFMYRIEKSKCVIMFEHSESFKKQSEKKKKDMILSVLDAICLALKAKYDDPDLKEGAVKEMCINQFKELNMFITLNSKEEQSHVNKKAKI